MRSSARRSCRFNDAWSLYRAATSFRLRRQNSIERSACVSIQLSSIESVLTVDPSIADDWRQDGPSDRFLQFPGSGCAKHRHVVNRPPDRYFPFAFMLICRRSKSMNANTIGHGKLSSSFIHLSIFLYRDPTKRRVQCTRGLRGLSFQQLYCAMGVGRLRAIVLVPRLPQLPLAVQPPHPTDGLARKRAEHNSRHRISKLSRSKWYAVIFLLDLAREYLDTPFVQGSLGWLPVSGEVP